MIVRHRIKHVLIAMCLAFCASSYADEPVADAAPVTAIWKVQQFAFNYRSHDVYYSCDTLRNKIRSILKAVGAREDIQVALRCSGLTNSASTLITLTSPIEATEENVVAATTYSSRDELVARLHKMTLPTANDVERFEADWRSIRLHRVRALNLDTGDCDLLRGLADQVFPRMAVRVEDKKVGCGSGRQGLRAKMQVVALVRSPLEPLAYSARGK